MSAENNEGAANSVVCLGTADGWPNGDRNHSSYMYQIPGATVLIDCGESVCRTLTRRRFRWDDLDAIVISHSHSDHLGGFFMLLQGLWLGGRTRPLTVHLPGHVIGPLRAMLEHVYLFPELLQFELSFKPIVAQQTIRVGPLRLRPYSNTHLDHFERRFGKRAGVRFDSYSFAISGGGRRMVHSADIGSPADLRPLLKRPADLLICEFAHVSTAGLIEVLRGREIEQLALVHVSREHRAHTRRLRAQIRKGLPGMRLAIPADGERLRF